MLEQGGLAPLGANEYLPQTGDVLRGRMRHPCRRCKFGRRDKGHIDCRRCDARASYVDAVAANDPSLLIDPDPPDPPTIMPYLDVGPRPPIAKCKHPHCKHDTRAADGYCQRHKGFLAYRKRVGIPLEAPVGLASTLLKKWMRQHGYRRVDCRWQLTRTEKIGERDGL